MKEFLRYCAQIPYNSKAAELPDAYDDFEKWGLDCTGFADLVVSSYPHSKIIYGTFKRDCVHTGVLVQRNEMLYFVDPFIRIMEPLPIRPDRETSVETYLHAMYATALYDELNGLLTVRCTRFGKTMLTYEYNIKQDATVPQPHPPKYFFLHDQMPIRIEIFTRHHIQELIYSGGSLEMINGMLYSKYGIHVCDVEQMFRDAAEYSGYLNALSR